jgi:hypothetical protein
LGLAIFWPHFRDQSGLYSFTLRGALWKILYFQRK